MRGSFYELSDIGIGYLTGCITSDEQTTSNVHPQLETLILGRCKVSDQGLQYISSGFYSLQHLILSSYYITNRGVGYLADMKSLKKLELFECDNINEECLKLLSNSASKITCLRINCTRKQFGDKALEYIGQSQLPLQELHMNGWNITDKGFLHLVKHGQNIKHLSLYYCLSITNKSLEIMAEKFTALRCLIVRRCNVTKQGVENLWKLRRNLQMKISWTYPTLSLINISPH